MPKQYLCEIVLRPGKKKKNILIDENVRNRVDPKLYCAESCVVKLDTVTIK